MLALPLHHPAAAAAAVAACQAALAVAAAPVLRLQVLPRRLLVLAQPLPLQAAGAHAAA